MESTLTTSSNDKDRIVIGYLTNPDKVFYSEMDDEIVKRLEECGAKVITLNLEDINFSVSTGKIEIYKGETKIDLDGFLNYGFMSKFHYEAFVYILTSLESLGIPTLHSSEDEKVLNNKYLQSLMYSKAGIPIPQTNFGFSVASFKSIANNFYPKASILKKLDDYGGDGVSCHLNKDNLINAASKLLWNSQYCIFQKFVKDSPGRSIRVLCINGKAVASAEYQDKTNNFKSNNAYGYDFFSLNSLMESPKLSEYFDLAEKTVAAIVGDIPDKHSLLIAGVDILDSQENGLIVLETNGWPDIYDIAAATEIDIFKLFASAFYRKVEQAKKNQITKE